MRESPDTCEPELAYLMRMLMTGQTTPEHVAAILGISVAELRTFLAASAEPEFRQIQPDRP